ncbi:2-iminoacetate synthase (ThiH) [Candidatus Syntrophocurvum alkaliphilum]|uniref:2-iminoacetate synthase (ThiH) n=1 Tax=Candidatus Syntrophocurvum alkaliphilum TaxID=2293317 RepID=A0A6I6DF30_9FIRM|nr:2-iminoacetate synthase ThiH [Candidatus Syntrophocurvum alkaliphilum]QGU00676.1 2-iminoacetate synthase (ThiH) [Candidatus Syntrophocurvum alkaliphilum]
MSFYEYYSNYKNIEHEAFFKNLTEADILRTISKSKISELEFLALLSPLAANYLEDMARRAHQASLQHFGKTVLLYTPMYLANHCTNHCSYCTFSVANNISRHKLSLEEIDKEAKTISATGLKHILVLTGESRKDTPVSYITEAVKILKKYFDSISIEIYPLTEEEYKQLIDAGVDGLTIYQEVYNEKIYDQVHISGPKKDYHFRLDAPERACKAKIRSVNIGALLGLNDWRKEAFTTGLHANYLQSTYMDVETSVSLPRLRPHKGSFEQVVHVSDKDLVQIMLALKIFMPYLGITISTREKQELRNHLIPLGVTKMSAGVSTEVGGHSSCIDGDGQFEISDTRSVDEIRDAIRERGFQPVFKNWMQIT